MGSAPLQVRALRKSFTLYLQGGTEIAVLDRLSFDVPAGACTVLQGASGSGKSTVLKLVYGNYRPQGGQVLIRHDGQFVDLASAPPRRVLAIRRRTLGYVSQFLRVIPRVAALDIVAEPLLALGVTRAQARARAASLLTRLRLPPQLFELPPATFSGGEQQRINIARGFIHPFPILLLDEPTAALDMANREVVRELIGEAKARGAAVLGIFHDPEIRQAVADSTLDLERVRLAA